MMDEISKLIESALPEHKRQSEEAFWFVQACLYREKYWAARQWNRVAFCVIVLLLMAIAGIWEGK